MKLTIRTKLLIGFSLFLLLSSIIQTFVFNLTNQYVSSQIELFQTDQAKKGAAEVEDFLTTLSLDNFGLASVLQKEYTTKGNFSSASIQPVTTYILKNKEYTK